MNDHIPDAGKMVAPRRTIRITCIRWAPKRRLWSFKGNVPQRGYVNATHRELPVAYDCVAEMLQHIVPGSKWRPVTPLADIEAYFAAAPVLLGDDFQTACSLRWGQVE